MMKNTLRGGEATARMLSPGCALYFLGIGGVGMASLARLARLRGFTVAGEDRRAVECAARLPGITVKKEGTGIPDGTAALIYTAALSPDHPTVREAEERGIPLISRSDFLACLMRDSPVRVTVAGSHGKSTVTAMLDHIFVSCGKDPTTVSGATIDGGESYRVGKGDLFLAEACEYTDSFLSLSPTHALLLNLELDHTDYFPDLAALTTSAKRYLANAPCRIVPASLIDLAGKSGTLTFGEGGDLTASNVRIGPGGIAAALVFRGEKVGDLSLPLPGLHNLQNALAAILASHAVGVPFARSVPSLADFTAPARRLTLRGVWGGADWYDDYAHHPSEVSASLKALRAGCRGRLICAFQSHTYSRTAANLSALGSALRLADLSLILPIYPARETDTRGMSETVLARAVGSSAIPVSDFERAAAYLKELARPGDVVVVMGAGDIDKIFRYLG